MSEFFRVHFQSKISENSDSVFCMRALELQRLRGDSTVRYPQNTRREIWGIPQSFDGGAPGKS
eukprot:COSAG05_NODE_1753_length_4142_cov_43.953500_4_plen_63_part_00